VALPFGIDPDRAALQLMALARAIRKGRVLISTIDMKQSAAVKDFVSKRLVIEYTEPLKGRRAGKPAVPASAEILGTPGVENGAISG